jgi:(p)ppGpp synthase/HD superfamily hydrolase
LQSEHSERVSGPGHPTVEDAIALAAKAHRGQRYASPEGEPYVFHPLRLMLRFTDPVEQMASVLHDVIEDTDLTIDDLVEAGYTTEVVAVIDCLTHRDDETYDDYIDRVARNDVARRVKIADVNENLANNRRLPNSPANTERIGRYTRALERLRSAVPERRPMSA